MLRWAAALVLVLAMWSAAGLLGGSPTHAVDASDARGAVPATPGPADLAGLDPGTAIHKPAPSFRLTDQFGQRVSLRSLRGRVVILAFIDPRCTSLCPLTTTAMLDARRLLGRLGSRISLVGVDANPTATALRFTRAYSKAHGMLHSWSFLTGSRATLRRIWARYGIGVQIEAGQIDHTPALFVIDPEGRLREVYLTQMSYAGVPDQARLLASEASSLIPGGERLTAHVKAALMRVRTPADPVHVPTVGGGALRLGGRGRPRLYLFFDTWAARSLARLRLELDRLDGYVRVARAHGLPSLTAVDEASVEPSRGTLEARLLRLRRSLLYPIAIDASGRIGDGYQVQDEPWLVLTSPAGAVIWHDDISTGGWPTAAHLVAKLRMLLADPLVRRRSSLTAGASRSALQALHRQGGDLLGDASALDERLQALRGVPIVLNAWASWCPPCQTEFPLLAGAARRYGQRVAFVGVDTDDSAAAGRAFLASHRVSYPSYRATLGALANLAEIPALPTTLFISPSGRVVDVHTGEYDRQRMLDEDITRYLGAAR